MLPLLMTVAEAFSQGAELPKGIASITMKNGKQINDVQLWALHVGILEYEKSGSLHDAVINDIASVNTSEENYFFDSTGAFRHMPEDLIITKNSDSIHCTIKNVSDTYHYVEFNKHNSQVESFLGYSEIKKYFINGEEHNIATSNERATNEPVIADTAADRRLYELGYEDAGKYYDGSGAFVGGMVSGFVPALGWFVTMPLIAGNRPVMNISENPDMKLLDNKNYYAGYKEKATKKKLANVFGGFGVGLGIFLMMVL